MKSVLYFGIFLTIVFSGFGQSIDHNTKKGYGALGYDLVGYFDGVVLEGKKEWSTSFQDTNFKFSSKANLEKFVAAPEKYLPKYGGYCAYAMALSGKKVGVNPETYEIRDGQLYLFYNSGRTNTLEKWLGESPNILKNKADKNWEKVKSK